ncbi:hypothetical protein ACHAW6_013510 [Cyclotella cf. meneghiniana]
MTTKLVVPLLRKSRHFAHTHRLPISIQTHTTTLHHQHQLFHITNRRNHTNSSNELPAPSSNDYFPWRHSPSLPARIENRDDFSGMPNNFRARFIRRMIAGRELNLKFWDLLPLPFERGWEQELAGNFSTAYGLALAELLRSVFKVPVSNDFVAISINSAIKSTNDNESEANNHANDGNNENEHKFILTQNKYLNSMMDKNLLARYQLVDSNAIHLKLSIRPTSAKLHHMFAIPLLTREIVEQKPHLEGGYLRIEKEFEETKSYDRVREMTHALVNEVGRDSSLKRTVIAEAVIRSLEFFQIKDATTGEILRGMQDGDADEEVVHVVRFEVVTDKRGDGGQGREVGNWKIIDWDDLLEGNTFH